MQIRRSKRTTIRSLNIILRALEAKGVNTYRESLDQRAFLHRLMSRRPK